MTGRPMPDLDPGGTGPDRAEGGAVTGGWRAVGDAVRARMRELHLNQKVLSELSGVCAATIRQMVNRPGSHQQSYRTLEALSLTLDWPPDHLIYVLEGMGAGEGPEVSQAGGAPPLHHLEVSCLGELPDRELAGKRAALLRVIGTVEAGAAMGAALALATVVAEQDMRAALYARYRDTRYRCTCGYECAGMEVMDEHLYEYPDEVHDELWARERSVCNGRA
jgi:hypothetical protein